MRGPNSVQVKDVLVRFCEPKHGFVSAGESALAVQTMLEIPDDSISKFQPQLLTNVVNEYVERENLTSRGYVIPHLPTQASV